MKKYKYLIELLSYLELKEPNENCINYLVKVFNTLIRVKGEELYEFFGRERKIMRRMVELI
jgi:hypothetical protein